MAFPVLSFSEPMWVLCPLAFFLNSDEINWGLNLSESQDKYKPKKKNYNLVEWSFYKSWCIQKDKLTHFDTQLKMSLSKEIHYCIFNPNRKYLFNFFVYVIEVADFIFCIFSFFMFAIQCDNLVTPTF